MKSSAPSSRALNTLRSLARDETAMTGVGRFIISQRRKAKPSMIGISRSSVMTSGRCFITCLMPSSPLTAVPTTLMRGSVSSIRLIVTRLYAESSMTSARIVGTDDTRAFYEIAERGSQCEADRWRPRRLASGVSPLADGGETPPSQPPRRRRSIAI